MDSIREFRKNRSRNSIGKCLWNWARDDISITIQDLQTEKET
jgi:hypothetical protein